MLAWHVVISKPSQEARAAIELAKQDFRVFLPILETKPMFPRYLFAQFDRDIDNWGVIKSTRGCIDLLKNGFIPANVPEKVMGAIMSYKPPAEPAEAEVTFVQGQVVKIAEGPCSGLLGIFQSDAKGRTMALLEIMGKRVELPRKSIRAS